MYAQLMQNPQLVQEMMSNPMVQQMMQDPEVRHRRFWLCFRGRTGGPSHHAGARLPQVVAAAMRQYGASDPTMAQLLNNPAVHASWAARRRARGDAYLLYLHPDGADGAADDGRNDPQPAGVCWVCGVFIACSFADAPLRRP